MTDAECRLCRILQLQVRQLQQDIEELHLWYRQKIEDREEENERLTESLNKLRQILQNMTLANTLVVE